MAIKQGASDDAKWERLRRGEAPVPIHEAALKLLDQFGVSPSRPSEPEPENVPNVFLEHLERLVGEDGKRRLFEEAELTPHDLLPPVEATALRLVQGDFRASDALGFYLAMSGTGKAKNFDKIPKLAFDKLICTCGDKLVTAYRRDDVNRLVQAMLEKGNSTSTVRRQLNSLSAAFGLTIREKELDCKNPFEKVRIPGEGDDVEERDTFTEDELAKLAKKVEAVGNRDDLWQIIGILKDTGTRLAEVVGLLATDVMIDDPIPHLILEHHPHRRLKNDESVRKVPLTGHALDCAKKALARAKMMRSPFLFSRYTDKQECRATAASQTLNNHIRAQGIDKTCHSFRHTVRDHLRAVECPTEIADRIGGWTTAGVGVKYGKGYPLSVLRDWMVKAIEIPAKEAEQSRSAVTE